MVYKTFVFTVMILLEVFSASSHNVIIWAKVKKFNTNWLKQNWKILVHGTEKVGQEVLQGQMMSAGFTFAHSLSLYLDHLLRQALFLRALSSSSSPRTHALSCASSESPSQKSKWSD